MYWGSKMKKILGIILIIIEALILSSCKEIIEPSGNTDAPLENYKSARRITIYEETSAVDLNDVVLKSKRTTNVDLDKNYTYSEIKFNDQKSIVFQKDDDFFYETNGNTEKYKYKQTNDVFRTLGFSSFFSSSKDYYFENGVAKKNIIAPFVTDYEVMYENINQELNTSYAYNPSILRASIEYIDDSIEEICFDLSLIFGSYLKSITRTVHFSFEEFTYLDLDLKLNRNEYIVQTAPVLDTYVQEMVYQYGDSIYIKSGDFDMLIDAGQNADGENVNQMLMKYCTDHTLDVLIATHGHADHVGGFENGALDSIQNIELILDYGYVDNYSRAYESQRDKFIEKGADYFSAYDCVNYIGEATKEFKFSDDLYLEVLDTGQYRKTKEVLNSTEYGAENDFSVVVKLTFKENTYLYTGDLSGELENRFTDFLLEENVQDITVYKAAHHGANSHNSNNQRFLNYLNPEICVSSSAIIDPYYPTDHSAGGSTVFQHPRPAFVRYILNTPKIQETKNYYYNGTMGTIHISDDGFTIPDVEGLGATIGYYMNGIKQDNEENKRFYDTQMYQQYYQR